MRKRLLAAVFAAAVSVTACQSADTSGIQHTASGSLALSSDDALLYAADTDTGILAVVDTRTREKIATIPVGLLPDRVAVAPDDTIYVANRGERTVSVVRRGTWSEAARIDVGVEPSGLAVSPDGRTLYVVNATSLEDARQGSLQAVDTATLQTRWTLPVGEEPRGLTLLDARRAAIALHKEGAIVTVDLEKVAVVSSGNEQLYQNLNRSMLAGITQAGDDRAVSKQTFRPRALSDLVASPDGQRIYATGMLSSEGVLGADSGASGGGAYGGGPCSAGGVASPGLLTFQASDGRALTDDVASCFGAPTEERDFPSTLLTAPPDQAPIQGPGVIAVDPTGTWLFIANRETDNVAVVPTTRAARPLSGNDSFVRQMSGSAHTVISTGAAPNGIALTRDGKTAYVYSPFDHTITVLAGEDGAIRRSGDPIRVAEEILTAEVAAGRRLFFTALDSRMSASTNVACASCHPDGREDGHVWMFPEGPRQTPSLAGRAISQTAPFHWNGEFGTLDDFFSHTVTLRMGGSGVTTAMANQLVAFMDAAPTPDNPHRTTELDAKALRGQQVFEQAQCHSCHEGQTFTNNTFADVGTFVSTGPAPDDLVRLPDGLNTPSLLGVSRTAPYLHDGSAQTLEERLLRERDSNLHGETATLTDADIDALVHYLKTL